MHARSGLSEVSTFALHLGGKDEGEAQPATLLRLEFTAASPWPASRLLTGEGCLL